MRAGWRGERRQADENLDGHAMLLPADPQAKRGLKMTGTARSQRAARTSISRIRLSITMADRWRTFSEAKH
jgi:hypothetical protein